MKVFFYIYLIKRVTARQVVQYTRFMEVCQLCHVINSGRRRFHVLWIDASQACNNLLLDNTYIFPRIVSLIITLSALRFQEIVSMIYMIEASVNTKYKKIFKILLFHIKFMKKQMLANFFFFFFFKDSNEPKQGWRQ